MSYKSIKKTCYKCIVNCKSHVEQEYLNGFCWLKQQVNTLIIKDGTHEALRLFSFPTFCWVLFINELLHNLCLRMVKNQFRTSLTIHFDHIKGFPKLNLNMQESFMMLTRSNDYVFSTISQTISITSI